MFPEDLKYTTDHEWVRLRADGIAQVGITGFAQEALGDIVYADLPAVGSEISAGEVCGEVESTKSVSEIYAPVSGVIVARNEALEATPETINADPYGAGWLFEVEPADAGTIDDLLDAEEYSSGLTD